MKILVYGAGVLGCNLARNLLRTGKDVTLFARGNWAAEIKQNGLRIKDKFSLRTSVSRIPVVTELAPDAMYDVIFAGPALYTAGFRSGHAAGESDEEHRFCGEQCAGEGAGGGTAGKERPVCLCAFCRASGG